MTLTGTGAAASVAFGLLVFAAVLASLAIPRESTGLRTAALQHMIASSPPGDRTVVGTIGLTDVVIRQPGEPGPRSPRSARACGHGWPRPGCR